MHLVSGCRVGHKASVRGLHWNFLFVYPELYYPCISLVLFLDARLLKYFLDRKRSLEVPDVICSPSCESDTVAATCQSCIELSGAGGNVLEPKFCLKFSSPGEILINWMCGYPVVTTKTDPSFLSASLGLQKVTSVVKDMSWR